MPTVARSRSAALFLRTLRALAIPVIHTPRAVSLTASQALGVFVAAAALGLVAAALGRLVAATSSSSAGRAASVHVPRILLLVARVAASAPTCGVRTGSPGWVLCVPRSLTTTEALADRDGDFGSSRREPSLQRDTAVAFRVRLDSQVFDLGVVFPGDRPTFHNSDICLERALSPLDVPLPLVQLLRPPERRDNRVRIERRVAGWGLGWRALVVAPYERANAAAHRHVGAAKGLRIARVEITPPQCVRISVAIGLPLQRARWR